MRRGLREGLVLRVLLLAPYRCKVCSSRFWVFSGLKALRIRTKRTTLLGFLGFHDTDARRFKRTISLIVVVLILFCIAIYMVHFLSTDGRSASPWGL